MNAMTNMETVIQKRYISQDSHWCLNHFHISPYHVRLTGGPLALGSDAVTHAQSVLALQPCTEFHAVALLALAPGTIRPTRHAIPNIRGCAAHVLQKTAARHDTVRSYCSCIQVMKASLPGICGCLAPIVVAVSSRLAHLSSLWHAWKQHWQQPACCRGSGGCD